MPRYEEWMNIPMCPSGWSMGISFEQHNDCEYCRDECYKTCESMHIAEGVAEERRSKMAVARAKEAVK